RLRVMVPKVATQRPSARTPQCRIPGQPRRRLASDDSRSWGFGSSRNVVAMDANQADASSTSIGWTISISATLITLPAAPDGRSRLPRPRPAGSYPPLQPFDGIVQVHVADEADCVDDGVRDRQWQHSAGPLEPPAEDDAHHHVPEESTKALIQVIAA